MQSKKIIHFGDEKPRGTYVLCISIEKSIQITPGKLTNGKSAALEPGKYFYVGSAMGETGAPIARRIIRHTTRSSGAPHQIHKSLITHFISIGWLPSDFMPGSKKVHWHIDHLLEEPEVEICSVLLICSTQRLEQMISDKLSTDERIHIPISGFGASDDPGNSHLFLSQRLSLEKWIAEASDFFELFE